MIISIGHSGFNITSVAFAGGKKKGGSRLANMWSKAPAVKEKPKHASKGKAAAPAASAVDADAALRSAQQVLILSSHSYAQCAPHMHFKCLAAIRVGTLCYCCTCKRFHAASKPQHAGMGCSHYIMPQMHRQTVRWPMLMLHDRTIQQA